jgi:ubiquinone/menaquinone biosynthesis C-methylase UbiE
MRQLRLSQELHVRDVGSGLGGAARFVGSRYGCRVTGVDLTAEFVETARTLSEWTGLGQRLTFHHGSALALPFADVSFDAAYMLHVGMNILDKRRLAAQVARVLTRGGLFGIYDVMRTGPAELMFPVPWAAMPELSALATPEAYKAALRASGFEVVAERSQREFAHEFYRGLRARMVQAGGPPPLGLHLLMGRMPPRRSAT